MILGVPGEALLLELVLSDEAAGRFPRVTIYDEAGAVETGPLDLADRGGGLYQVEWAVPTLGQFSAVFLTFSDAGHTTRTDHEPGLEHLRVDDWTAVADAVLDEDLATHVLAGSHGLAQILQHYGGEVFIDTASGSAGAAYPRGTEEDPVSNLADALTIAAGFGIRRFAVRGSIVLTSALDDWAVRGNGEEAELSFGGQDVADSEFGDLRLTGAIGNGPVRLRRSELDGVTGLEGTGVECALLAGECALGGDFRLEESTSAVPGTGTPALSVGLGNNLELRGHKGGVELRDLVDAGDSVSLDVLAGQVVLAASCTAGTIALRGIGNLTELQAPAVVLEANAFLNLSRIADAVLDEAVQDHLAAGSLGESILASSAHAGLHVRDDALTWDGNDRPLSFRRRVFPDRATAEASTAGGTAEGEIATILVDASHVTATRWDSLLRRRFP